MSRFPVAPPATTQPAPAGWGRLGPALERLAAAQGAWPPTAPRSVRTVVVPDGLGPGPGPGVDAGVREADDAADAGVDLLVLGSAGDQVAGLVVAAVLLGLEPVEAVGTSAGPDWAARTVGVRRGVRACREHRYDPDALLASLGDGQTGRLAGLLAQSAVRRTPVLLDGSPGVAGAALLASRLAPGAQQWWLAGQSPVAPGAAQALDALGLVPLLDLELERPEGAALAQLVLVQAVELVGDAPPES